MVSVIKNGQPGMEEILASIRRIVADDPNGAIPLIDLNGKVLDRSRAIGSDDGVDFELPSMFRERRIPAAKSVKAPIGRLTDAIRKVAPSPKTEAPEMQAKNTQKPLATVQKSSMDHGDVSFGVRPKSQQTLSSLTSSVGLPNGASNGIPLASTSVRPAARSNGVTATSEPVPGSVQAGRQVDTSALDNSSVEHPSQPVAMASAGKTQGSSPRVMAPFRDTLMASMSGPSGTSVVSKTPVGGAAHPAGDPSPEGIGSIVPGDMDLPGRGVEPVPVRAEMPPQNGEPIAAVTTPAPPQKTETSVPPNANIPSAPVADMATGDHNPVVAAGPTPGVDFEANPPPLPQDGTEPSDPAAVRQVEDATADLLRPMLRQWLTDNMPRMVEKALHIEVAESVRMNKTSESS